ncbi:MAG: hypothetical protein NUW22_15700 [Acidobacteria bacterium]|nr:hypothetical protein [Acidobacteriota bacterium]
MTRIPIAEATQKYRKPGRVPSIITAAIAAAATGEAVVLPADEAPRSIRNLYTTAKRMGVCVSRRLREDGSLAVWVKAVGGN